LGPSRLALLRGKWWLRIVVIWRAARGNGGMIPPGFVLVFSACPFQQTRHAQEEIFNRQAKRRIAGGCWRGNA